MKSLLKLAFAGLLLAGLSCGPGSYITNSWKAAGVQPKKYSKVVVVALVSDPDRTMRERLEQHIAGDLSALGYTAVCSCDEYNPKAFENFTEEQAVNKLKNSGVDAVLTVVLLNKTLERYYVPGQITYTPYAVYHNRFYPYYRTMYTRVYSPGYYVVNTEYFWESNFYDLSSGELVYSAQSRSFDPSSAEKMGHEYGQMIVNDMLAKNVLGRQTPGTLKPM
jgi:hypothetical protein